MKNTKLSNPGLTPAFPVVQPLDRPAIGRFGSACLVALTTLFVLTGAANAGTLYLSRLSGAGENPPTTSTATGLGVLILNDAETQATITATHDISLPLTGGHIHRGAANVNGPVIFAFAPPASPVGPLTWSIPAGEVGNLKNSGLYMNFHTAVNPGGAIRGQLVRALLAPAATSGPQGRVASALDISAGYTAELNQILVQANLASSATQTLILEELSGRTIYVPTRQEIEAMSSMTDSLFARADDVRLGGAPAATSRVTPFILAGDGFGQRPTDRNQAGSTISRPFLAGGIDCRFNETSRGGLALGFTDAQDTFKANVGQTKTKLTSLQAFASGELGATGVMLDAVFGYGWGKTNSTRQISSLARTATASPSGKVWSAAIKASKAFTLSNKTTLIPYALFDSQDAIVNAYSEAGAGAVGLVIPRLTTKNSAFEGGAALILPITIQSGHLTARLQAGWHYLLEEGKETVTAYLVDSPVPFATQIAGPGNSAVHVEASLTAVMTKGMNASLSYRGMLGADRLTTHAIEARIVIRL